MGRRQLLKSSNFANAHAVRGIAVLAKAAIKHLDHLKMPATGLRELSWINVKWAGIATYD